MPSFFLLSYYILWAITAILTIAVYVLLRHYGQTLLNSRESRKAEGPAEGTPFPTASLASIGGEVTHLPLQGHFQIVLLGVKQCSLCEHALVALSDVLDRRTDQPPIAAWFVYTGNEQQLQALQSRVESKISRKVTLLSDSKGKLSSSLGIVHVPFGIAIAANGTVVRSGLTSKRDQFSWLIDGVAPESRSADAASAVA